MNHALYKELNNDTGLLALLAREAYFVRSYHAAKSQRYKDMLQRSARDVRGVIKKGSGV